MSENQWREFLLPRAIADGFQEGVVNGHLGEIEEEPSPRDLRWTQVSSRGLGPAICSLARAQNPCRNPPGTVPMNRLDRGVGLWRLLSVRRKRILRSARSKVRVLHEGQGRRRHRHRLGCRNTQGGSSHGPERGKKHKLHLPHWLPLRKPPLNPSAVLYHGAIGAFFPLYPSIRDPCTHASHPATRFSPLRLLSSVLSAAQAG